MVGDEVGLDAAATGLGVGFVAVGSTVVGAFDGEGVGSSVVGSFEGAGVGSSVVCFLEGDTVGSSVVGSLEGAAVLLEDPLLIDAMGDSVRTPVGEYVSSEGEEVGDVTYVGTTVASDASLVTVGEDVAGVRVEGGKVGGTIGV